MEIYDISQEVFNSYVYPGDPQPQKNPVRRIKDGAKCNLTEISMCCHNGTHVDAPYHFIDDGKTIDKLALDRFVGRCVVVDATLPYEDIINEFKKSGCDKLILKGDIEVTIELAQMIVDAGAGLIGVERCTVGNQETGERIHKIFLSNEIIILEGICLDLVQTGIYMLCAQPINLAEVDGSPCRAILIRNFAESK